MRFLRCDLCSQGTIKMENSCKLEVERTPRHVQSRRTRNVTFEIVIVDDIGIHGNTLRRRELEPFARWNTKGGINEWCTELYKARQETLFAKQVDRQSETWIWKQIYLQCACSLVYINICYKCFRVPIVLGILLIEIMLDFSLSVTLSR